MRRITIEADEAMLVALRGLANEAIDSGWDAFCSSSPEDRAALDATWRFGVVLEAALDTDGDTTISPRDLREVEPGEGWDKPEWWNAAI